MAKILHVIHSANLEGGGPIEGVRQRGKVLEEMGHEITVATLDVTKPKHIGLPVIPLGEQDGGYGKSQKILDWLSSNHDRFDHVIANGIWQFHSFAVWKVLNPIGKPYFVFPHGMLDPWFKRAYPLKHLKKSVYWRLIESKVLRDAEAVLFTSEEERLLARESFRPYKVKERVVRYGTAAPQGNSTEQAAIFRESFPKLGKAPFLLFLSRIHPKKGCDILLEAFAEVAKSRSNLNLVIAGPDQVGMQKDLQVRAKEIGLSDQVHLTGMLKDDLKWGAYHACEAFILPSHQENFGIVVAEALACSKPVLITNKINIWREIQAAGAGIVNDDDLPGTVSSLNAWLSLSTEDQLSMGRNAKRCFEDNFEIRAAAQSLLQVLSGEDVDHARP